jgi:hypothetical protein
MENKNFENYHLANISNDDVISITNLEKQLSEKTDQSIVLIAYQPNDLTSSKN